MNAGDQASIEVVLADIEALNDPFIFAIAKRFANSDKLMQKTEFASEILSIPLADLKAVSEKTGYGPPIRDRLPEGQGIHTSGGKAFASGLYADAPAEHAWELGGTWRSLTGIADGKSASVKFRIVGDGKVFWESEILKGGATVPYKIDLTEVNKLTLLTEDGGDGRRNDWGLWSDPMLGR